MSLWAFVISCTKDYKAWFQTLGFLRGYSWRVKEVFHRNLFFYYFKWVLVMGQFCNNGPGMWYECHGLLTNYWIAGLWQACFNGFHDKGHQYEVKFYGCKHILLEEYDIIRFELTKRKSNNFLPNILQLNCSTLTVISFSTDHVLVKDIEQF